MNIRNGMRSTEITGVNWQKSRGLVCDEHSNSACVEAAGLDDGRVAVRNSTDPSGPALVFTSAEWSAFAGGVREGQFDNLA